MLTQSDLHELFNFSNGILICKKPTNTKIKIGDFVGSLHIEGYLKTKIYKKEYLLHRLIFMWNYGYLPKYIDHINGIKTDNRIENLRPATNSQNCQNSKKRLTNTSGYKNVFWRKDRQKWTVLVSVNNKLKSFGCFDNLELADLVAQEAREKYHKEFARHL